MKVFLNHQEIFVGSRVTLKDLLAGAGISAENSSVAVNNCIITSLEWAQTMLSDGDKVTVMNSVGVL